MLKIRTFKQSIFYGFLFATFMPLIFLGYFSYTYLSFKITEAEQRADELLAASTAKEISSYLQAPLNVLRQVWTLVLIHNHDDKEINDHLNQSVTDSHLLDSIYIVDERKKVINIGLNNINRHIAENI